MPLSLLMLRCGRGGLVIFRELHKHFIRDRVPAARRYVELRFLHESRAYAFCQSLSGRCEVPRERTHKDDAVSQGDRR